MIRTPNPDLQRWNQKYNNQSEENESIIGPNGEPELIKFRHLLSNTGLAVEIACGKGHNALYLASLGYRVVAIDGAYSGLKICHQSAKRLNLPVSALVCDLESIELPEKSFRLISVIRYLYRPLIHRLKSAVKPGGVIFYKTFNTRFLSLKPNFNPKYVVKVGELNDTFSDFEILASDHGQSEEPPAALMTTSFILAKRP